MSDQYAQWHISSKIQEKLSASTDPRMRIALATGASCSSDVERLGLGVLLSDDSDARVSKTAKRMLNSWNANRIVRALAVDFHSDVLEYVIEFLNTSPKLHQMMLYCENLNERTLSMIARETDEDTCQKLVEKEDLLLRFPKLYWELESNPNCPSETASTVKQFLESKGEFLESSFSTEIDLDLDDLEAEILASLSGELSPTLQKNQEMLEEMLEFDDIDDIVSSALEAVPESLTLSSLEDAEVSFDLSNINEDGDEEEESEELLDEHIPLEQAIKEMSVGHKIKLAYKGNKEARSILIRDTNKSVAVAVIKSGRLSDGEVAHYAGNRNLVDDVIREIANNKEYTRKYAVKAALVANPKTPLPKAISFIYSLHKKDLQQLCRNKNVPAAVRRMATRYFREKYTGK